MVRKGTAGARSRPDGPRTNCCRVEAVITMDERGQLVLPKAIREKAGIKAGDKLAVTSWEKGGEVCCIALMKVEGLADQVRGILGPVLGDILNK